MSNKPDMNTGDGNKNGNKNGNKDDNDDKDVEIAEDVLAVFNAEDVIEDPSEPADKRQTSAEDTPTLDPA